MSSLALLLTCGVAAAQVEPLAPPPQDVVLKWNEVVLQAVKAQSTPPPQAARHLAMAHIAVFDAVNSVTRTNRFFRFPGPAQGPTSAEAAAAVAAHRILVELYPRRIPSFDTALDECLEGIPDEEAKAAGVALGQAVAEKVLAWRRADGSAHRVFTARAVEPGVWRPTPPGLRSPLLPQWRYVTPFGGPLPGDLLPPAPPALTSREYTVDFHEVKLLGSLHSRQRTAEQTLIAHFWNDGDGTVTPAGHWNRIAQEVSRQRGLTLAENARLFALLNICLADAAILCWECKFGHSLWRPITAIREADRDGNPDTDPDPTWTSLLTTPPFPSYTSGHSSFSGAGAAALAYFFGTDAVPFRIGSDGVPGARRSYDGFWAAAEEAGRSRIYGGIHYEFDNRGGLNSGKALAERRCRTLLRPVAAAEALTPSGQR
jgi:hypothetical protein